MSRRETNRGFSSSSAVAQALTSSLSSNPETLMFSETIPGNKMGKSKKLSLSMLFTMTTAAVSLPTLTIKIKLGTQTFTVVSGLSLTASQNNTPFTLDATLRNKDDPMAQIAYAKINQTANSLPLVLANSSAVYADLTADTTVDQTLQVTAQFGGLSSGNTITLRDVDIDLS